MAIVGVRGWEQAGTVERSLELTSGTQAQESKLTGAHLQGHTSTLPNSPTS